jgi:uncharacterized protein
MAMALEIRHEEAARRFVASLDGGDAVLEYEPAGEGVLDFVHTYVPDTLRHRQVGTQLVMHALRDVRAKDLRVIPSCWFVRAVIERHPELAGLLAR